MLIEMAEANIDNCDRDNFNVPQKKRLKLSSKKGGEKHFPVSTPPELEEEHLLSYTKNSC